MVMAKIDRGILKPLPKPLPKPAPTAGSLIEKVQKVVDGAQHSALDADKNGKLNRDEFNAGEKGFFAEAFADEKFDKYDADNDGYITKDEHHDAREDERVGEALNDLGVQGKAIGTGIGKVVGSAAEDIKDVIGKGAKHIVE